MRRSRTGHLGDVAGNLIKKWEKSPAKKGSNVLEAWVEAVEEKALGHAKPVAYKKGIITVIAETPSWLYKLTMEKRDIIKRFNESYKGRKKATEIRFRIGKVEED